MKILVAERRMRDQGLESRYELSMRVLANVADASAKRCYEMINRLTASIKLI